MILPIITPPLEPAGGVTAKKEQKMKLRNKITGAIHDIDELPLGLYNSLAEIMGEWEDYKPVEPLIKDEKIRKAVRAWAEANRIGSQDTICFNVFEHRLSWFTTAIEFSDYWALSYLEKEVYTITELCGEEEE